MVALVQTASVHHDAPQGQCAQNNDGDECYYNNKVYALAGLLLFQSHLSLLRLKLRLILFCLAVAFTDCEAVLDDRGARGGLEGLTIVT